MGRASRRRVFVVLMAASLLAGCARADVVAVSYAPTDPVRATGSGAVRLVVVDERPADRERISTKINTLGMSMGAVQSETEVREVVHQALREEFERRGYALTSAGSTVTVTVERFENDYAPAGVDFAASGTVVLAAAVTSPSGAPLLARGYQGRSTATVFRADAANAAQSVAAALGDAIARMFADPAFRQALATG